MRSILHTRSVLHKFRKEFISLKKALQKKCFFLVGVTGFEPATSCSQSKRATNCATPRNIIF